MNRIFVLLCLNLSLLSSSCWSTLTFQGFLREVTILATDQRSDSNEERISEEKYVLLLSEPEFALLPTASLHWISFVVLEKESNLALFNGKYVTVEGVWKGMAFPSFENVPILKVAQISEDDFKNSNHLDETTLFFLEEQFPIMAEGACKIARWQALASGCKVLEVDGNQLVEISPDGTRSYMGQLGQPFK